MKKPPSAAALIISLSVFFTAFFATPSRAAVLRVPHEHKTIQEAMDAASGGDTILVDEGSYTENIVIAKPVDLKSVKGAEHSIIIAASPAKPAVTVAGVDGGSITGITASGSDDAGIRLQKVRNFTLKDNVATGNNNGISLYESSRSIIEGNSSVKNASYGVYLEKSKENRLVRNTASSNDDKGFFISYSDGNEITGNSANLNTWNGMLFFSSHGNTVRDNITLRNMYGMVFSEAEGNTVEGNSSLPNIFLILPILLVYIGILSYLTQKNILKRVIRS